MKKKGFEEPLTGKSTTAEPGVYYFNSPLEMESLFAGDLRRNLAKMQSCLGVETSIRDLRMLISSGSGASVDRALDFLKHLEEQRRQMASGTLDQRDFDQILAASANGSASDLHIYFSRKIPVSPRKRPVVPRSANQLAYVQAIRESDIVFGTGPAGTGKTYLAMALAVSEFLAGKYERIILTRPAVEAGESLGFLPGKLEEKINPYLRPRSDALYDMLEVQEAASLMERSVIEVAPLAFMRGRTLNNAFVILDEAQNATSEQMLMFLTRLGFRSKCVVAGDPTQVDLAVRKSSGLPDALRRLKDIEEIRICRFTTGDVVRHSLVEKIINAYSVRKSAVCASPEPGAGKTAGEESEE